MRGQGFRVRTQYMGGIPLDWYGRTVRPIATSYVFRTHAPCVPTGQVNIQHGIFFS